MQGAEGRGATSGQEAAPRGSSTRGTTSDGSASARAGLAARPASRRRRARCRTPRAATRLRRAGSGSARVRDCGRDGTARRAGERQPRHLETRRWDAARRALSPTGGAPTTAPHSPARLHAKQGRRHRSGKGAPAARTGAAPKQGAEGWALTDSNRRHPRCKRGALPTELRARRRECYCSEGRRASRRPVTGGAGGHD